MKDKEKQSRLECNDTNRYYLRVMNSLMGREMESTSKDVVRNFMKPSRYKRNQNKSCMYVLPTFEKEQYREKGNFEIGQSSEGKKTKKRSKKKK